jgi:hypothetical protein
MPRGRKSRLKLVIQAEKSIAFDCNVKILSFTLNLGEHLADLLLLAAVYLWVAQKLVSNHCSRAYLLSSRQLQQSGQSVR